MPTTQEIGDHLALVNACLNASSATLILLGRRAIAKKNPRVHKRFMLAALATSATFLVSYLTRVALTGTHDDPHHGVLHYAYFAILFSHMILAIAVVPLVLRTIFLALKGRISEHKKIVKYTYPIWLYVSVTGVIVYVILYRVPA